MRIKKTKVYPFDELSDEIKEKVVEKHWYINTWYAWWQFTYDDAKNIGLTIIEFNIDRGAFCRGDIDDAIDTARAILKEHGDSCETWQTAKDFHDAVAKDGEDTEDYENLCLEFKYNLLEDYRIILAKEYEYLTSEEAIIETIQINEYEFTADGELV